MAPPCERALSFAKDFIVLMINMVDIPNATPIGQERKTLTFKTFVRVRSLRARVTLGPNMPAHAHARKGRAWRVAFVKFVFNFCFYLSFNSVSVWRPATRVLVVY